MEFIRLPIHKKRFEHLYYFAKNIIATSGTKIIIEAVHYMDEFEDDYNFRDVTKAVADACDDEYIVCFEELP